MACVILILPLGIKPMPSAVEVQSLPMDHEGSLSLEFQKYSTVRCSLRIPSEPSSFFSRFESLCEWKERLKERLRK